jgi:RimJ/RimL family protein N-acetyltransferase
MQGIDLSKYTARVAPPKEAIEGQWARLEPLSADAHAALLFRAFEGHDAVWEWLPYGPFHSASQYHRWVRDVSEKEDPAFYAIFDKETGRWGGVASYLRIDRTNGSIEVGHINLSPGLQRTRAASEALMLMITWAMEEGYRRFEWKCNALNIPSRRAAERLGFSYEGVFRNHLIVKGQNRDTAWFAITDSDWPALKEAYAAWLSPANFDGGGQQRERLGDLTRLVRISSDPALIG